MLETHCLQGEIAFEIWPTFSGDGSLLACAFATLEVHSFHVWDTNSRQRSTLTAGYGPDSVAFSPRNECVALARQDVIDILAWPSGQSLGHVPCERGNGEYRRLKLGFCDADRLWILHPLEGVQVWDVKRAERTLVHSFGPQEWGCDVAFRDGELTVLSMAADASAREGISERRLTVVRLATGERLLQTSCALRPQFTPDLRRALIGKDLAGDEYEVWDLVGGRRCGRVPGHLGAAFGLMQLSADGRYVAWPSQEDKRVKVWDAQDECMVQDLDLGSWFVPKGFSPTHQFLVAVANSSQTGVDRTLFVNALTGARLGEAAGHPICVQPEQLFSPCGRWFASALSETYYGHWHRPAPVGTVLLTDLGPIVSQATPIDVNGS